MNHINCLLLLLFSNLTFAQPQGDKASYSLHLVELVDKKGSLYSVFHPEEYLTAKALDRRLNQGILIDQLDLPISPNYIQKIVQLGAPIQGKSKWLNALAVHTESIKTLNKIKNLPFVKSVQPLGKFRNAKQGKLYSKRPPIDSSNHQANYYGLADRQIDMLKGKALHQLGYTGKGVHVAIVDGGFRNTYRMTVFDSLYLKDKLLGTQDFVDGDDFVYESSVHGTNVLSIMAANRPHLMVGTAPDASYYLFKTEDVRGEYKAEEFNWVVALEHADSLGVDVVNSSMGYNRFRDTAMSYQYHDLDGKTTLITQGANIATAKGIFIVNAAGNQGHKDWHYLAAPADAPNVFTVAAVDEHQKRANFSSWGPTYDGRIKPDVAAQGSNTAYASMIKYDVGYGDGTSYACPVIAGMVASLKQAFPTLNNAIIQQAIRNNSHQATRPDSSLGYGIPNFWDTYLSLSDSSIFIQKTGALNCSKKIIRTAAHVYVETTEQATVLELTLYNLWGQQLHQHHKELPANTINKVSISNFQQYGSGVYALKIKIGDQTQWIELVR
ncbi:S8 family serine peptidase [Aureispira anguillae]|uniref:S8 family serine peptidase n=1 Tax=Aureispira anguillae TaxID=2864201 RepID=A0A916DSN5_9BACT|nr:S8 family serine peptidase [Aureispira anguillae]BDS11260.1 S8 family serine peptidase [Aureispira anguillae]